MKTLNQLRKEVLAKNVQNLIKTIDEDFYQEYCKIRDISRDMVRANANAKEEFENGSSTFFNGKFKADIFERWNYVCERLCIKFENHKEFKGETFLKAIIK